MYLTHKNMVKLKAGLRNSQVSMTFLKNWGHVTFEIGKKEVVKPVFDAICEDIKKREVDRKWFY